MLFSRKCKSYCKQEELAPAARNWMESQKRNAPWRIPRAVVMTALESFLIPSTCYLTVPIIYFGGCSKLNITFTESLDLQNANDLFFCVLKIYRTPRCLLETDKQVETRRGLYSPPPSFFPTYSHETALFM